jgi:hypothetical protein
MFNKVKGAKQIKASYGKSTCIIKHGISSTWSLLSIHIVCTSSATLDIRQYWDIDYPDKVKGYFPYLPLMPKLYSTGSC